MSVLDDLTQGFRDGYPACCVLRYTVEELLWPGTPQANRRGARSDGVRYWVPCGWLHKPQWTMRRGSEDDLGCVLMDEVA